MSVNKKCFHVGDLVKVDSTISAVPDAVTQAGAVVKGKNRTGVVIYAGNYFITVRYLPSIKEPRSEGWCESFMPFDFFGISKAG